MNGYSPFVVDNDDGTQTLISIFVEDGEITVVQLATRHDRWSTWSPPTEARRG